MAIRDYTLLAEQPVSSNDLTQKERDEIVISAVLDDAGQRLVLSRYSDMVWELWPFFDQANVQPARKRIDWSGMPAQFREPCKAVLYRYWMMGTPGVERPNASTLVRMASAQLQVVKYLDSRRLTSLLDVHPLHIANFLHEQRTTKGVGAAGIAKQCQAIELWHRFGSEHPEHLTFHPWPDESIGEVAGTGSGNSGSPAGKTPLIPKDVVALLYRYAESILERAGATLDERDAGLRSAVTDVAVIRIRDACFFLLGLLTGMRCDEIAGVSVGAGRTEVKDGVTYYWVKSIEHKTKKGPVEYLMPSVGLTILRVMERWSYPLRERLRMQLAALEADTAAAGRPDRLRRIAAARSDINKLFLSLPRSHAGITTVSGIGWHKTMRKFAVEAGTDWLLAPHQLRRTYAWTFVRHRLGNMLFLKEQFKHSSLAMTQLYAANPQQDPALYDEILNEMREFKVELIQHWMDAEVPLSGGAGKKIMALRAHAFDSRKELIEDTAEQVHIRSNGHAWCLAQDEGCGGAGLYERTRCAGCSDGCIDDSQAPVWQEIYAHQMELVEDAKECGPGAQQRVERDCKVARQVLTDLGMEPCAG